MGERVAQIRSRPRRRWLLAVAALVVVALIALGILSNFYVDILWFREVHYSQVFWRIFWTKLFLGSCAGVLFFLLFAANLVIARRLTPRFRVYAPEREVIERYRVAIEPYAHIIIPVLSGVVALFVGLATAGQWQTYLLWRSANASTTFVSVLHNRSLLDPLFHRDPSFYIFILPFQQFVQGWLFSSLTAVTVVAAVAHYFTGGIRTQGNERVTPQVKAHLSVLIGLIVLVKAWGYYLGRFDLLTSERGVVTGASYTDIHAELPALKLLVVIAIVCAILFLVNIRFRGWALPVIGIGLLFVVSIVIGAIVPALVEKFSVQPQQLQREAKYIGYNIAGTRFAYGLNSVRLATSPASAATSAEVGANTATTGNIRLWSPGALADNYSNLQRFQPYYAFDDVDVDRYMIDGNERMVMLSPRDITQNGLPRGQQSWQNVHLTYTHGYGAVASLVNSTTPSGAPNFVLQDIPVSSSSAIPMSAEGAQIYYSERSDVPYVVVGTKQAEVNYPSGAGVTTSVYRGRGGIPIGSFFRRLVFAYRYRDINLLISGLVDSQSRIMIRRSIQQRVPAIAPFLKYDGDPYAAVVNGRLFYIWDAYTTTNAYPYSEETNLGQATGNQLTGQANYIRNSVKVVVDAYNGTVHFYVVDPQDPLIRVWERAFPGMFTPWQDAQPRGLLAHFRYPENLLEVQAQEYTRYHVTSPAVFYNNSRRWAIPAALPQNPDQQPSGEFRPYYVLMRLPGDTQDQFVLLEPMTPYGRNNLLAYLAGGSDGLGTAHSEYGKLTAVQFPAGENIDGPSQVRTLINQDPATSQQITLLGSRGSKIEYGDLIILPIGTNSIMYVQPIFLVASQTSSIPELKLVSVVNGGNVYTQPSLSAALQAAVGQQQTTPPPSGGTTPPVSKTLAQLLAEAVRHFQLAQTDLKNGDLVGYAQQIKQAQGLVEQANKLLPKPKSGASPSPSPSASPTG